MPSGSAKGEQLGTWRSVTGPMTGGTFRARLIDVAVGDDYIVAVQHAIGEREGRRFDITGCKLMSVKDGLFGEVRGHYSDQEALDRFWT